MWPDRADLADDSSTWPDDANVDPMIGLVVLQFRLLCSRPIRPHIVGLTPPRRDVRREFVFDAATRSANGQDVFPHFNESIDVPA